jgi:putative membrane protein
MVQPGHPGSTAKGRRMLWLKTLHVFFVVSWFAGLFYLPRLFVYHASTTDTTGHERFVVMERRLFAIMSLGAIGSVSFGLWLMLGWWWPAPLWLHVKLGLVALLLLYHMGCYKLMRDFRAGKNRRSPRFYRIYNEVPALLLLAVLLLVELKPSF